MTDKASVVEDRSQQMKAAKHRGKYEIKWDGKSSSFDLFQRQLEGHLLQEGAGHLFNPDFVAKYKENGIDYFKSDTLWDTQKISYNQAIWDMKYLYGILMTATREWEHKAIINIGQPKMAYWHGRNL